MTNALYWHASEPAAAPPPGDKLRLDRPMPPALENGMTDETSAAEMARVVQPFVWIKPYDARALAMPASSARDGIRIYRTAEAAGSDAVALYGPPVIATLSAEVERLRAEVEEVKRERDGWLADYNALDKARNHWMGRALAAEALGREGVSDIDYADTCARIAKVAADAVSFPYASRFTLEQVRRLAGDKIIRAVQQELSRNATHDR